MSDSIDYKNPDLKEIPDGFLVSVDDWFMDSHFAWFEAGKNTDKNGMAKLLAKAISKTPYNIDPRNPNDYLRKLKPNQWQKCVEALTNACSNCFLD